VIDYANILQNGVEISSSGTTGEPKMVLRTPENLQACIDIAIDAQQLVRSSKVLTVTRMTHAGGLLTQTLPAYSIGAEFKVQQFNAFTFLKDFADYTHTFLAPAQMTALMNTKGFVDCDLTGKRILGGSDPVSWEMIEAFVSKGAIVQPNWGMSEIGPITINIEFDSMDKINYIKQRAPDGYTIMGDTYYCDWKIVKHELYVKGSTSIYDEWFATGDIVALDMGRRMYYLGRKENI
tara:strand:+ start:315 stop:1022 length:708 start_codon:yes stop_codon:yes gene_type:complete